MGHIQKESILEINLLSLPGFVYRSIGVEDYKFYKHYYCYSFPPKFIFALDQIIYKVLQTVIFSLEHLYVG